jgi:ferredoxin
MTPQPAAGRLHVDWTRCDGRGLCAELLPELLTRDDWGYPLARSAASSRSNVDVPLSSMDAAHDAVRLCPLLALKLIDVE